MASQSGKQRKKSTAKALPALTPGRKRIFTTLMLLFPVILLLLLEFALRMAHYGPDLSLFATEEMGGRLLYVMNPDVKARYFSKVEFSPNTSIDYFQVPKPSGTFRIFCLGGSTTVGYPYGYAGSFSAYLRDRLHALFPDRPVEVINLGMTATNSFTVADIAGELMSYEPDLLIVYDGHNEFYGALGIASRESFGSVRWITRLYLKLIHLRSFQLLKAGYNSLTGLVSSKPGTTPSGTMMEQLALGQYIPSGSDRYRQGLEIFRSNLADLHATAEAHGVRILLSSQVSNLRDQPPFISRGQTSSSGQADQLANILARATRLRNAGSFDSSVVWYREALKIDSGRADAIFGLARALDSTGLRREAAMGYVRARDNDQLRFRTSSDFNNAIRAACDGRITHFVDIEDAFRRAATDSLIGYDLILEHLHPNAKGYFLMAKEYAEAMRNIGLLAEERLWAERDTIPDESLWARRSLTDLDERCALRRTELLVSGWPFTAGNRPRLNHPPASPIDKIVERLVAGKMTWEEGHVAAAEYYARGNDFTHAAQEYSALVVQLPYNVSPRLFLGQIQMKQGRADEARETFERSLDVEKTGIALVTLGKIAIAAHQFDRAIGYLREAISMNGSAAEATESRYLLALAFFRSGDTGSARTRLEELLQQQPRYRPALALLDTLRAKAK